MSLLSYRLQEITEGHLHDLCQREVPESVYIEYKKEMYKLGSFEDELDMLKDVVGFANAAGGDIVIGVKEKGGGIPEEVCGIEEAGSSQDQMMRVLITAIQPRIPGLTPRVLQLNNGKSVLIVRIPRSPLSPHMLTLKGRHEFWRRHDRNKSPMSVEEIRQACLEAEGLRHRAEDFLANRAKQLKGVGGGDAWLVVSTTPMLLRENLIDPFGPPARELILEPPPEARDNFALEFCNADAFPPLPTLRGSVRAIPNLKCLEVWTNGYCEFRFNLCSRFTVWERVPWAGGQLPILHAYPILYMCKGLLAFAERLYEGCGYLGAVAATLSIIRADGVSLRGPGVEADTAESLSREYTNHLAESRDVALPPRVVPTPRDLQLSLRPMLDTLWRAYHFGSCPCFDGDGSVVPDPQRRGSS